MNTHSGRTRATCATDLVCQSTCDTRTGTRSSQLFTIILTHMLNVSVHVPLCSRGSWLSRTSHPRGACALLAASPIIGSCCQTRRNITELAPTGKLY